MDRYYPTMNPPCPIPLIMHYSKPPSPSVYDQHQTSSLQKAPPPTMVNPPPLTHPPLGPSNSIHPFTHGCFEAPPPPRKRLPWKTCNPPPPRKTIDMENMNLPLFSMWAIYLAPIYALSIIVSVVAMTFFMHLNFTDLLLNGH